MIGDVKASLVEANVGADVPGGERGLVRGIAAYEEDGGGVLDAVLRGEAGLACGGERALERCGEGDEVGRAVVVDVVGADHRAGELLEEVVLLVGGAVGADDADAVGAAVLAEVAKFVAGEVEGFVPADGRELAVFADERGGESLDVVGEVEGVAALVAEEVAVHAGLVAIVAAQDFGAVGYGANAEGGLAAVAAVGADGGGVVHLPGAGLVAVGAGGERAYGAGVDAHAALLAVELG